MYVPNEARRCVCFVGIYEDGRFLPRATAFLVIWVQDGHWFRNLVTAEHVISGLLTKGKDIWVRVNLAGGGTTIGKIPPDAWYFHPDADRDETDVATCIFNNLIGDDMLGIPLNGPEGMGASTYFMSENHMGPGDETVIVGLFRSHYGADRNVPIVRIGNLATLADERVATRYCGSILAHLVEARSIAGLSGSPVFISLPSVRIIHGRSEPTKLKQFHLIGLIHGHFDVQSVNEDMVVDDEEGGTGINTGIGVVVPVEKIIETVDQPELRLARQRAIEEGAKAALPAGDADVTVQASG